MWAVIRAFRGQTHVRFNRGSFMSAHVYCWGKEIKCEACGAVNLFYATIIQEHKC